MDGGEETGLTYYDRDINKQRPEFDRAGFLVPLDVLGMLSPAWLVLIAVAVATPLVAGFGGRHSSFRWDIAIGFYGSIFAAYLMIPWGASYLLWRVAALVTGSTITFAAGAIGIAVAVVLVAVSVLEWSALAIALFSLCGMISSAIWKNAGR
jgi:hypothetical protein